MPNQRFAMSAYIMCRFIFFYEGDFDNCGESSWGETKWLVLKFVQAIYYK